MMLNQQLTIHIIFSIHVIRKTNDSIEIGPLNIQFLVKSNTSILIGVDQFLIYPLFIIDDSLNQFATLIIIHKPIIVQMANTTKFKYRDPQAINTDLRLIRTYLNDNFEPVIVPNNLKTLSSILKNRLTYNTINKQQKKLSREWLSEKGISMQSTVDFIKKQHRPKEEIFQDSFVKEQISKNIITQPLLLGQQQFATKWMQNSTARLLSYAASSRSSRRNFFAKVMDRFHSLPNDYIDNKSRLLPVRVASYERNYQKQKKYIEIIVELTERQIYSKDKFNLFEWAKYLSENIDHKIWRIINGQLYKLLNGQTLTQGLKLREQLMKNMLINSLLQIEKQFDEELPLNSQSISYYLQQKYLSQMKEVGKYLLDPEFGCVWGKVFLYFRAGREKQLTKLLDKCGQQKLASQVRQSNNAIKLRNPKKLYIESLEKDCDQSDIFRQQIVYALSGQRKYSNNIISDPLSLDCLWIFLRNTGIFYDLDKQMFQQIREQMINFYNKQCPIIDRINFLAYLLDYDSIVSLGQNEFIDRDDYLHLLIVLNKYPFLAVNQSIVEQRLIEMIGSYVAELANLEQNGNFQYYLLQLPQKMFNEQASSIIVNQRLYSKCRWKIFEMHRYNVNFEQFVKKTTQKYVVMSDNYLEGAENMIKIIKNIDTRYMSSVIDMLIRMLIKHTTNAKIYDGEQIVYALKLLSYWIEGSFQLERDYSSIIQLFQNDTSLTKLIVDRNFKSIEQFLLKSNMIVFFSTIDYSRHFMLSKLIELKGIDVIFTYMKNILKAVDFAFSHIGKEKQMNYCRHQILMTCRTIVQHQSFKDVQKEASFKNLVQDVNSVYGGIYY